MSRRHLDFKTFEEARADANHLLRSGYDMVGQWNLAQTCDHLTYFINASLEGHRYKVPWLLKVLFGRWSLKRILTSRRMKAGVPTPFVPPLKDPFEDAAAVERYVAATQRLEAHPGAMHASPFFGEMTPDQARDLNLIHSSHHLSFLIPKS